MLIVGQTDKKTTVYDPLPLMTRSSLSNPAYLAIDTIFEWRENHVADSLLQTATVDPTIPKAATLVFDRIRASLPKTCAAPE